MFDQAVKFFYIPNRILSIHYNYSKVKSHFSQDDVLPYLRHILSRGAFSYRLTGINTFYKMKAMLGIIH